MRLHAGRVYSLGGKRFRLISYDDIQRAWVIECNGVRQYKEISSRDMSKLRYSSTRKNQGMQIYLMSIGDGTFKAGCTSNVDQRLRAARTWCPDARVIARRRVPDHCGIMWRQFEKSFLKMLPSYDGRSEVVRMSQSEMRDAKRNLRSLSFN